MRTLIAVLGLAREIELSDTNTHSLHRSTRPRPLPTNIHFALYYMASIEPPNCKSGSMLETWRKRAEEEGQKEKGCKMISALRKSKRHG